jgi:hypothetical protein
MARCELADLHTVRRAGYDAAIAFLLGAPATEVLPILKKSVYPDGDTAQSCASPKECLGGMTCDPVEKLCRSTKAKVASFLSRAELDIEDLLVRAMTTKLTPQMIERERFDPDDLIGTWVYGRYTKCDGALCKVTRSDRYGKRSLIHSDHRYVGESSDSREPWQICHAETNSVTRDGCIAKCPAQVGKRRAACVATCTTLCPIDPPNSGPDD